MTKFAFKTLSNGTIAQCVCIVDVGSIPIQITDPLDVAGRLPVAEQTVLGEYKHLYDKIPKLKDEQGTGTSTFEDLTDGVVGVKLAVTPGQYLVRESKYAHYYNNGNEQEGEMTYQNMQPEAGIEKRVGYFSSSTTAPYSAEYDGIILYSGPHIEGLDVYIQVYRKGVLVDETKRSDWTDPLDGSGPSEKTIDFANFGILSFRFLWLGGKAVRTIFAVGDTFQQVNVYEHAGLQLGMIIKSPNQPLRYEIRSTTGTGYLYDICSKASTQGSLNLVGTPIIKDLNALTIKASSIGTYYIIVGIRLNQAKRNQIINITGFGAFATTSDAFRVSLLRNPTISGTPSWQQEPNSALEYFYGDTVGNPSTITAVPTQKTGTSGVSQQTGNVGLEIGGVIHQLARNITNTSDIYVVAVVPLTNNMKVSGQIQVLERV